MVNTLNLTQNNLCGDEIIKPIYFRLDYIDYSLNLLPEKVLTIINSIPYLKLFVDAEQYTPANGTGSSLEFTGKGNYYSVKAFRTGFSAQFDYSEYEILKTIKQLCYYSITNEVYIEILDTLNPLLIDSEYTLRQGIIQSPISHKGRIQYLNPDYLIDNIKFKYAVPGGFNLTFLDKNSSYL